MYNRVPRVSLMLCLAISSVATSQEVANPTPTDSTNEHAEMAQSTSSKAAIEGEQLHKLPKMKAFPSQFDAYPELAHRRNLEGRVLVEFGLDQSGKPTGVTIVQAEAPSILQDGALRLMKNIAYDMTDPGFDAADARPFRLTIKFCLPDCTRFTTFPGSVELAIRSRPLPPEFRR